MDLVGLQGKSKRECIKTFQQKKTSSKEWESQSCTGKSFEVKANVPSFITDKICLKMQAS